MLEYTKIKRTCNENVVISELVKALSHYEDNVSEYYYQGAIMRVSMHIGALSVGQTAYLHLPLNDKEETIFSLCEDIPQTGSYIIITKVGESKYEIDKTAICDDFVILCSDNEPNTFVGDVICVYEDYLSAYDNMCKVDSNIIKLADYAKMVGKKVEELNFRYT